MKHKKKIAILMSMLMVFALAGLAAVAVAGQSSTGTYNQGMQNRQMGSGGQNWGGQHGSNWNNRSRGNWGNMGNMNAEDRQKMQREYDAFLKDTQGLRQELDQKNVALRNELARQNPDDRKVADLQNETARLKSQLYQKEQVHMEKMRKINPNMGRGRMGGGMMGHGVNQNMMGPGSSNTNQ
jgi:flagellar basal body-associated protein FliL